MHGKGEWKIHVTLNVAVNQDKNKYKSSSDPRSQFTFTPLSKDGQTIWIQFYKRYEDDRTG